MVWTLTAPTLEVQEGSSETIFIGTWAPSLGDFDYSYTVTSLSASASDYSVTEVVTTSMQGDIEYKSVSLRVEALPDAVDETREKFLISVTTPDLAQGTGDLIVNYPVAILKPGVPVAEPRTELSEGGFATFFVAYWIPEFGDFSYSHSVIAGSAAAGDYTVEPILESFTRGDYVYSRLFFRVGAAADSITEGVESFSVAVTFNGQEQIHHFVITAELFTNSADTVDFNKLDDAQKQTIGSGVDIYKALDGNDTITLPDANNEDQTIAEGTTLKWDHDKEFNTGPGNDKITVPSGFVGTQTIDGGSENPADTANGGKDVLILPGSANDYVFTVTEADTWSDTQTSIQGTPFPSQYVFTTNDVEQAKFEDPVDNVVTPAGSNTYIEVGSQILSAYLNSTSAAQGRGWHPVAAIELGVKPKDYDASKYKFVDGTYVFIDVTVTNTGSIIPHDSVVTVLSGVVDGKETLAISFKGSDWPPNKDLPDWFADFSGRTSQIYDEFQHLTNGLLSYIKDNADRYDRIVVSGHSLGGALTQYFLEELAQNDIAASKVQGITFGSIGASSSAAGSAETLLNLMHDNDIARLAPGGTRYGKTVFITSNNSSDPFTAHLKEGYQADLVQLVAYAKDTGSPFHTSSLAQALLGGSTYLGEDITVWLGTDASETVRPNSDRNWVLAGGGDDTIFLDGANLVATDDFRIIDGGEGDDDLLNISGGTFSVGPVGSGLLIIDKMGNPVARTSRIEKVYINGQLIGPDGNPVGGTTGKVSDGYIAGATVFADANNNGVLDAGEATDVTDDSGTFNLLGDAGPLIAKGGTDTATGLIVQGTLSAPQGSTFITPLTTLIAALSANGVTNSAAAVLAAFSLDPSTDLTTLDPIGGTSNNDSQAALAYTSGVQVFNTLTLLSSALGGGASNSYLEAFNRSVKAFADLVVEHGATLDLTNSSQIKELIGSVMDGLDAAVVEGVAEIVSSINAAVEAASSVTGVDLLGKVSAIALVAQGAAADALKNVRDDLALISDAVNAFTGDNLQQAIAIAIGQVGDVDGPANLNAPQATADAFSTNEDTPLVIAADGLLANDHDFDSDPLTASVVTGPAHGSLTLNADGSFTYVPDTNYFGQDSFAYKANDDGLDSEIATVSLTINPVNDAPITIPQASTVNENGLSYSRDLLIGTSDPDQVDPLAVANLATTVTSASNRVLTLGNDYTLAGSTLALTAAGFAKFNNLSATQSDQFVFHYNVSDGNLATANTLTVTVDGANDAPSVAKQTSSQAATAGAAYSFTLPGNTFNDVDNGDHLTLSASALPAWLSFDAATGHFGGTPSAGDVGGFDINVMATDAGGLAASETVHFTVGGGTAQDHSPVISSNGAGNSASVIITDHSKYVATVHAVDEDAGTSLTYSIAGGKNAKLFAIDPMTGVLSFKSYPQDHRTYQVTVEASDGNLTDTQQINVSVGNGLFMKGHANELDTFVFKSHFGLEIVKGFDATGSNQDILELHHSLFRGADPDASASSMFELIKDHSFQLGRDVIIVTDTHEIIDLQNVRMSQLSADSFHII